MPPFQLLASGLDVKPLVDELDANPQLWDQHSRRKTVEGTPHSRMSDIWLRYNDCAPYVERGDWTGFNDPHIPIWYPAAYAMPTIRQAAVDIANAFGSEMLGGVLITRIPGGGRIDPHVDRSWHVDFYDKLYLSLRAPEGVVFGTPIQSVTPRVGDLWLFDNRVEHWVTNDSDEDRITLIICIRTTRFGRFR